VSVYIKHTGFKGFASDVATLPLGVVPTGEFRYAIAGEPVLNYTDISVSDAGYSKKKQIWVPSGNPQCNCNILKDHRPEIAKVYGKPADELTPPEGYEFTGEFREADFGESYLSSSASITQWLYAGDKTCGKYLILRSIEIETNHGKGQTEVKRGFTAAEVTQKFGKEVVTFFVQQLTELYDLPGFVYTGELTHPKAGNWYMTESGWVGKAARDMYSLHFILEKIETAPRIITYTLTDRADLEPGEAGYTPLEDGGMTLDNTNGPVVYTRSEVE
jgi:hypothetical protein